MKLIADSGSTKTDWRLIDDTGKISQLAGSGLNPYFFTVPEMSEVLEKEIGTQVKALTGSSAFHIYFYGAGCGNDTNCNLVKDSLKAVFPEAESDVYSDLLGAARGLCGHSDGIVSILGTGMNSGLYNGREIIQQQASLGFILGDEGSGAYLGKQLLADYLNGEMPESIRKRMDSRFTLNRDEILNRIYKQAGPNRYLAGFSKFIYQNIAEQYCVDLVVNSFRRFFDLQICKYPRHQQLGLSCTGSVAFWYSNLLRRVAEEKGVSLHKVVESPIAGLALYYSSQSS